MSPLSLLCLPAELQTLICQALCSHCGEKAAQSSRAAISSWQDGDEDAAGRRALRALCLTSRHLYAVSLPVLFHQFCLSGDGMHKKAKDNSCALTDPMSPHASVRNDSVRQLTSFASVVALAPHLASRVEKIHLDMNVLFRFRHDKDIGLAVTMCSGLFGVRSSGKVLDALRLAREDVRVKADDGEEMGVRALARLFLGLFPRLECLTLHNLYPWWWLWSSQLGYVTLVLPPSASSAPVSTSSQCAGLARCLGSEDSVDDGLGDAMVESSGLARVDKGSTMTVKAQPQGSEIHLCSTLPAPLSLPRLRRLHIQYGLLDGHALGAILSTCPALETFSYIAGWPKSQEPDLNCAPQQVDHFQLGQACWELGRFAGSSLREVVLDLRQVLMPLAFFGVDEFTDSTRHGFRDHFPGLQSLTLGIESVYAGRYWEPWDSSGQEEDTELVDMLPLSIVSLHLLGIVTTRGAEFLPRLASGLRAVAAAKAAGQLPQLEQVTCAGLKPPDLVEKIANRFSECGIRFGP